LVTCSGRINVSGLKTKLVDAALMQTDVIEEPAGAVAVHGADRP
jgi:hypothetical protein